MKVLIINGPNLNLLSKRNKDLYGGIDFDYHLSILKKEFKKISINYFQSNIEGKSSMNYKNMDFLINIFY